MTAEGDSASSTWRDEEDRHKQLGSRAHVHFDVITDWPSLLFGVEFHQWCCDYLAVYFGPFIFSWYKCDCPDGRCCPKKD